MDSGKTQADFSLVQGQATSTWKQGVEPLLAEISLLQAYNSEPVFHALNAIRSGEIVINQTSIPNLKDWFSYYKNHNKLFRNFIGCIASYFPWGKTNKQFGFKDILTEDGPIPQGCGVEGLFETFTPIKNLDLDWESTPSSILFTFLIWVPCNSLFGENPPTLLYRARHGDIKAARKLIQLDKSIFYESGIARKMLQWQLEGRSDLTTELGGYLGEPIPEASLQQIKLTWARFIQDTSIRAGEKLTAPKIQALFNAITQDSGRGLQDPDIGGMSPEAFAKALNRRKNFWQLSPSK